MKQTNKNVPTESKLLFEDDLNKRINQTNKPTMTWQNQHLSEQIKMVETKFRYPTTPPANITSNQKMDIPPE